MTPTISKLAWAAGLSGMYFAGLELGRALSLPAGVPTFWPPIGILTGALLTSGHRAWPWIVLTTLPGSIVFDALHHHAPVAGIPHWTATVLGSVLCAWMLRRVAMHFTLTRARHVLAFVAVAVLGTTISAAGAMLAWQGSALGPSLGRLQWMGHLLGVVAAAPLVLAWTAFDPESRSRRGRAEWTAFFIVVTAVTGLAVGHWLAPQGLIVVVVPLLSWAAWRLGPRGTGVALPVVVTLGMKNHLDGVGVLALGRMVTPESMVSVQAAVGGIVVTFLFITAAVAEWRALEQALRQANQLKREFVSTISHELRTPLAAILGYLEMARDERFAVSERLSFMDDMDRAARQLHELIEATLDVGRLEAGRDEPRLEPVSLSSFWQELKSGCATIPRKVGVDLRWSDAGSDLLLVTDRRKLTVVLRNLITNALKFTERGWVRVEAEVASSAVVFRVRDTGIGIRPEDHARIFEMYRQADGSDTRRYEGTGLGLHIVRRFLEQLGGTVTLESAPGEGSTFTIRLSSMEHSVMGRPA